MVLLAFSDAVDIGGGRGRLAPKPAASLRRVDSAFGRAADINEAWRSPEQADQNYRAYVAYRAYRAGVGPYAPWAPLAYAAKDSIHCRGGAVDTDDTNEAQMRVWNDHGWFWTVYRDGKLIERWHLEYFESRDNHRNDPLPETAVVTILEDSMANPIIDVETTLWIGRNDGTFEQYETWRAENSRGIISKVFYGGTGTKDLIPSLSKKDFEVAKTVWRQMCRPNATK